jgi:hypothetical protein
MLYLHFVEDTYMGLEAIFTSRGRTMAWGSPS